MRKLIGVVLTVAFLVCFDASIALADNPTSATKCPLDAEEKRSLGATLVTSLAVEGISCEEGERVTIAFNNCRTSGGRPRGRCQRKVAHYRCSEWRYAKSSSGYTAAVACLWGGKRVLVTYVQGKS